MTVPDDLGPDVRKKLLPAKPRWALRDGRLGKQSKAHSEHESLDMHLLNPGFVGTYHIAM